VGLSVRLWVFRIATAIAVPVVLLVTVEAGLRLLGFGYQSEFTLPCTVQGHSAFCDNDHFTWQFFPPGAFRLPPAFAIPAEKPPGTFRIFIVGESAVVGVPEPSYAFGRYLEVMLRDRFPSVHFEVINTAITSVNSHVLLPAVRDLAHRDGDLFIMYIGNNEVVGPYGAGTTLTRQGGSLALIRASIYLNSTRLGQLLGGGMRAITLRNVPQEWRGLRMFIEQQVPADAPTLARMYDNFRGNLRDIVAVAQGSGAPVLISTVGVNLKDSAPFASLHRAGLTPKELEAWERKFREGKALEEAGRHSEALESHLLAAAIDDRYAELQYRIGRVYYALGEFTAAQQRFELARDLDTLRFRADDRINEIIRSVAKAAGPRVELIDAEQLFDEASPHGVPGRELFYEHVHMNPHGNYLLARALFPRVVALLPEEMRRSAATVEPPSEEEANRLLALTAHDRRRVAGTVTAWLGQPPFTGRLDNDEQVQAMRRQAEGNEDLEETAAAYRWAINKAPQDRWLHFNYGLLLEASDPAAAAAEFRHALELLPSNYEVREKLADALVEMGKFEEVIAQCHELLRQMPYHAPAYLTMAYAQARLASYDESIAAYERAIELHPAYAPDAYNQIGIIQLHQGSFDRAAASFKKAMAADTGQVRTADLSHNLSYALEKLGRYAEAQRVQEHASARLSTSSKTIDLQRTEQGGYRSPDSP
jgi:tetratricopeptide (TPR) repeat protein